MALVSGLALFDPELKMTAARPVVELDQWNAKIDPVDLNARTHHQA
jgi:hypothetical protein